MHEFARPFSNYKNPSVISLLEGMSTEIARISGLAHQVLYGRVQSESPIQIALIEMLQTAFKKLLPQFPSKWPGMHAYLPKLLKCKVIVNGVLASPSPTEPEYLPEICVRIEPTKFEFLALYNPHQPSPTVIEPKVSPIHFPPEDTAMLGSSWRAGSPAARISQRMGSLTLSPKAVDVDPAEIEYQRAKQEIEKKIISLLLEHKKLYFATLSNLAELKPLNTIEAKKALDKLRMIDTYRTELLNLKTKRGKKTGSGLMTSLQRLAEKIQKQEEDIQGPDGLGQILAKINTIIDIVSKTATTQEYDSCNECGKNLKKPISLECGHIFCPDCGMAAVVKAGQSGVVPKCLIPYCYYIIQKEELSRMMGDKKGPMEAARPMTVLKRIQRRAVCCAGPREGC